MVKVIWANPHCKRRPGDGAAFGLISKCVLFLSKVAGSQGVVESQMWDPSAWMSSVLKLLSKIEYMTMPVASHHIDYLSKLSGNLS